MVQVEVQVAAACLMTGRKSFISKWGDAVVFEEVAAAGIVHQGHQGPLADVVVLKGNEAFFREILEDLIQPAQTVELKVILSLVEIPDLPPGAGTQLPQLRLAE